MPIVDQYNSLIKRVKLFITMIKRNRKTAQNYLKFKIVAYYTTESKYLTPFELYRTFTDAGISHEIAVKCISDARHEFTYTNKRNQFKEALNSEHNKNLDYYNKVVTDYNSKYKI